ncbi:ATP-binding cassette domain-containing protein [Finegoldia sp. BIOML-A3]|nr:MULTISPECIES: ABC transporter ATP-binding protein [unclassified Finegoldia]MSA98687.1 ATP-binding cassette domain-containing protein [Finegoldia sp. BIOML-A3]MSB92689.1 ATP-binding cassette domain-containing protein [Finegoldia sp. BIOML-A4]
MKLVIKNLTKKYDDKLVLDEVNYEFKEGVITSVLGRNGAGKTTLFNVLYDEIDFDSGEFYLENEGSTEKLQEGSTEKLQKEDIGMLFSENFLPEFLTGYEYIKFYRDINSPNDIKTVEDYMEMMEFSKKDQNRLIKDYSHGMKSKISLITLFISRPKVLLLDEPLTSLDVVISTQIKKLLMELKSQGRIIVLSTHMLDLAKQMSEEIVLLHHKKLQKLDLDKNDDKFDADLYDILKDETDE